MHAILYLQHSLVNNGVATSLANDEIGPLYDNDGHEESRMARVLEHFTLGVRLQSRKYTTMLTFSRIESGTLIFLRLPIFIGFKSRVS